MMVCMCVETRIKCLKLAIVILLFRALAWRTGGGHFSISDDGDIKNR